MHHRFLLILSAFLLPACTIEQQNGNEMNLTPPPLIAGNQWRVAQQLAMPDGDRICTVLAGEMDVTLRSHGKTITPQVATSTPINPGDYYRVIYGNDVHETSNGSDTFSPAESQAIIADLMKGGIIYTEIQQREIHVWGGGEYERLGNKINLDGFVAPYKACSHYVSGRAR